MKNSILIQDITPEDFASLIGKVVDTRFIQLKKDLGIHKPDELLSRSETCEFLKINSSTLWAWTNKGKVTVHAIGNRRYYKKSELLKALILVKK